MTVHILYQGQSLCRFSKEIPANWPDGHTFVGAEDKDKSDCLGCKTQADFSSERN